MMTTCRGKPSPGPMANRKAEPFAFDGWAPLWEHGTIAIRH